MSVGLGGVEYVLASSRVLWRRGPSMVEAVPEGGRTHARLESTGKGFRYLRTFRVNAFVYRALSLGHRTPHIRVRMICGEEWL